MEGRKCLFGIQLDAFAVASVDRSACADSDEPRMRGRNVQREFRG